MAWSCPACSTVLRRGELESKPQPGERYRCYVCRLSLDFDPDLDRLVVAPFETDHATSPTATTRARTLPPPLSHSAPPPTPGPKPKTKARHK